MRYVYFLSCNHTSKDGEWGFSNYILERDAPITTKDDISQLSKDLSGAYPDADKVILMNFILLRTEEAQ